MQLLIHAPTLTVEFGIWMSEIVNVVTYSFRNPIQYPREFKLQTAFVV